MSKISEELIKLSNKPTVGGTNKRTLKLPSYAIKSETHAEAKVINNIIPIDSLKGKSNVSKEHKRTLCLNVENTHAHSSTQIVENRETTIESIVENINSVVENFESQVKPIKESITPIIENCEPIAENYEPTTEDIIGNINPIVGNFESSIENVTEDIDPIEKLLEYLSEASSTKPSCDVLADSIVESNTITSEPKIEENTNIDKKPVINLGSPFFYTPSVFKQYDITISDADGAEEDVHTEAKRILEESINASKNKEIASQTKIINTTIPHKTKVVKKVKNKEKVAEKDSAPQEEITKKAVASKKTVAKKATSKVEPVSKKVVSKDKTVTKKVENKEKIIVKKVVANTVAVPKTTKKKTTSIITTKPTKIKVSAKSKGLEVKKDFVDLDALISQDTVNEAYLESINTINPINTIINNTVITEPVVPVEPIIKETAAPIAEPVIKESATPVGILLETPNVKTSKKINTSKTSTFNSIFKKFSYDEAELATSANDSIDESPSISAINKIPEIHQTIENAKISQEKNVTELNVQASPVATIPVVENDVEVLTAIDPSNNYNSKTDGNILNVLTPQNNLYDSHENISNYIESTPIVTIEDLLNSNRNIKVEESIESDSSNIEPPIEEIVDTDDNEFSIENYFNLGNDTSESEEDEIQTYNNTVGENLIDDNADIEFELKTEKNYSEDEQNIINEIIKELDEDFVFEELKDYEIENQNDDNVDNIVIEDNNYKLVEESIFDNILNDISIDDIDLEDLSSLTIADVISEKDNETDLDNEILENSDEDIIDETDIDIEDLLNSDIEIDNIVDESSVEEIDENDIDLDDLLSDDIIEDDTVDENEVEEIDENEDENAEISSLSDYVSKDTTISESEIESILEYAISSNPNVSDPNLKEKLLTELFGDNIDTDSDKATLDINGADKDVTSDFLKVIDTLTQTISKLEQKNAQPAHIVDKLGKAINIEIDKDDIFSISILNETYEIVADFDGISVLSENIHISTPKNNFFVNIGDKYIEIHNQKTNFVVYTNIEDVEFANALNNVAFTKKNNRIELTIKEAFKLSSGNNKISLSMLNTSIADIEGSQSSSNDEDESSVCDNKTLVISEETQKVYLPYTIIDIMEKLNDASTGYQTVQDVIDEEYIVPLSEFKMPIISRFKESYKFMREKEKSSVYAAIDLALELMFNSNLNPAVIRACKNLRELNIYLDCLYENELEKFDCFKVIYKVLPKIQ